MDKEIERIWVWCNQFQAHSEAQQTYLIALISIAKEHPDFASKIRAASDALMADRFNRGEINDDFISHFQEHLLSMCPEELKPLLR